MKTRAKKVTKGQEMITNDAAPEEQEEGPAPIRGRIYNVKGNVFEVVQKVVAKGWWKGSRFGRGGERTGKSDIEPSYLSTHVRALLQELCQIPLLQGQDLGKGVPYPALPRLETWGIYTYLRRE